MTIEDDSSLSFYKGRAPTPMEIQKVQSRRRPTTHQVEFLNPVLVVDLMACNELVQDVSQVKGLYGTVIDLMNLNLRC